MSKDDHLPLGIFSEDLDWIRSLILQYFPGCRIIAFGSRVKGSARPYSDLDLALDIGSKIPLEKLYSLKDLLEESRLNYPVDLVDFHALPHDFQHRILSEGCLL